MKAVLIIGSFIVAHFFGEATDFFEFLGATLALITTPLLLAGIPWLFYKLIKKPLTPSQIMSTYTVAWLIVAFLRINGSMNAP